MTKVLYVSPLLTAKDWQDLIGQGEIMSHEANTRVAEAQAEAMDEMEVLEPEDALEEYKDLAVAELNSR